MIIFKEVVTIPFINEDGTETPRDYAQLQFIREPDGGIIAAVRVPMDDIPPEAAPNDELILSLMV